MPVGVNTRSDVDTEVYMFAPMISLATTHFSRRSLCFAMALLRSRLQTTSPLCVSVWFQWSQVVAVEQNVSDVNDGDIVELRTHTNAYISILLLRNNVNHLTMTKGSLVMTPCVCGLKNYCSLKLLLPVVDTNGSPTQDQWHDAITLYACGYATNKTP